MPHILITVCERDISVKEFDTLEAAQTEMKRQLFDEVLDGRPDEYDEGDDYGCEEDSAYATDIRHTNYDWLIHPVQVDTPMHCYHFADCGKEAVYELSAVENKTIHVCESCDEMYTACEVCGLQGIWNGGYGNMGKYRETDDWPTCFICQEILKNIKERKDMGLQLQDITGEQFEAHHLEIYDSGDLTGYIQGYIKFANTDKDHEFLYRVHDPKNGDANTLVSIDYGNLNPLADDLWESIESSIKQAYNTFISTSA